jgi:hypothetical protein
MGSERNGGIIVFDPESLTAAKVFSIEGTIKVEYFSCFAGAMDIVEPPDQHGGGISFVSRYNIKHPIHSVNEIDVNKASFLEHYICPLCPTFAGMTGKVLCPTVSLSFRNDKTTATPIIKFSDQDLSEKVWSNLQHIPEKKRGFQTGMFHIFSYPTHPCGCMVLNLL